MKNQEVSNLKKKFNRGDVFSDKCPSREILKHITSKWGLLILLALSDGEIKRFSDLKRTINGVSDKMLSQTLKVLEDDKLVIRKSYDVVPPYVEYSLTDLGLDLSKQVIGLTSWIEDNLMKIL